jgi:predicted metallopeptidase
MNVVHRKAREALVEYMRAHVKRVHGTASAWAAHLGVKPPYVSRVLSGKQDPSKAMLDDMGIEAIVTYHIKAGT